MGIAISNLRYASADHAFIDIDVSGVVEGETIPFTYNADDPAPLSVAIKAMLAEGGYDVADYAPPTAPPPNKAQLAAYAADLRYQKEIAGVAWTNGLVIQTDRESQSKMLSEFVSISAGLRPEPSPWKFADNKFANLSNADMSAVCLAARAYVAGLFASEETVQAQIVAGTFTTFEQIDTAFS